MYIHMDKMKLLLFFSFARLPTDAKVQSCSCTKFYRTDVVGMQYSNSNLQSVVTRTINWNLIEQR